MTIQINIPLILVYSSVVDKDIYVRICTEIGIHRTSLPYSVCGHLSHLVDDASEESLLWTCWTLHARSSSWCFALKSATSS